MQVFIDTNVLLNFFHFSDEELGKLTDVFASHEHGAATVHLTEQVRDEFRRNREAKIKDALKRFRDTQFTPQLPSFMKSYEEFEDIKNHARELRIKAKTILSKANNDISAHELIADKLIKDIFDNSEIIATTDEIYQMARRRMKIGNPPGKNNSIGDAINWIMLLANVPCGEPLHIISEDGDFFSRLDEECVNPFLEYEWREKKQSPLHVYRKLSGFMDKNFDGVAFSFDKDKDALIDGLACSGSFAETHRIIASLEKYHYFSLKEIERILQASIDNGQFGGIVADRDVVDFLNRVAIPRRAEIGQREHLAMLELVAEKLTYSQAE